MKRKDDGHEERCPWQIEQGDQQRRRDEPADIFKIPQGAVGLPVGQDGGLSQHRIEQAAAQLVFNEPPGPGQQQRAAIIQHAHRDKEHQHQQRERGKSLFRPG